MKKKIIYLISFILVAVAVGYYGVSHKGTVAVETFKVSKGDLEKYIEETGVVKTETDTTIYANEGGRVLEILVSVGDRVKAGDTLVKMDEKEWLLQLQGLEAQKEALAAQYREAKKPANQEQIRKAQAMMNTAKASVDEAKRILETNKKLYEEGAVSLDHYQQAQTNLTMQEASLEAAKSDLELLQKGTSAHVKEQYEAQIKQVQSQIDLLKQRLTSLTIKAPVEGVVMAKNVEKGSFVQPGVSILEIGEPSQLFIESDILVSEIAKVKEGARVRISNGDIGIENLQGTVRKIYPKAFSKVSELGIEQKRIKIEIAIEGNSLGLRPGYDMNIKILTDSRNNTLWIPESAVFEYKNGDYVFVNSQGTATLREIKKGMESGDQIEVLEGLAEGEMVILSPNEQIKEGSKIQ